jgi:ATP-binding cassette subfamily B protein
MREFPLCLQHDRMDCGAACLQMISKYYGVNYPLAVLKDKSFLSKEGVSMLGISKAAESLGFKTFGAKLDFKQLSTEAPLPCIVHWNQNHFVVVYKIKKNKVYVADPGRSKLTFTVDEFNTHWVNGTGVGAALLLEPTPAFFEKQDNQEPHRKSITQLFTYLKGHEKFIPQLILSFLLISGIQLIFPFLTQSVVDVGINTRNVNFISLILIGQLVLFFSQTITDLIRRWILLHMSIRVNILIMSDFLIKLLKLPLSFFDSKHKGDLLRRIEDHARIEKFLTSSSLVVIFSFFNLIIFSFILLLYSVKIFTVFIILSIFYFGFITLFMKRRAALDHKRFQQMARNQSNLIQIIEGIPEIKLSNSETLKRWEWEQLQVKLFKVGTSNLKLAQYQDAGSLFIHELKNIIITYMAATAVISGEMTLGMMLTVQYIIGQLNSPINSFIMLTREWQDAKISLQRINEVHLLENEQKDQETYLAMAPPSDTIHLNDVSFHYGNPIGAKALNNISISIPKGKTTAIVGASGSGKTTLLKLLLKFYEPETGKISLGSTDFKFIRNDDWRDRCGAVLQDGYIFSDTIARNIALSEEHYDFKKLDYAAQVANIKQFIEALPSGYLTKIGKEGIGISEGQKQRMLIARAVYKNPEFIFFDEATSSLDTNNERVIIENLNHFFKDKTVLIIAHRLSTVRNADEIIVLDQGKVVERGTHEALVSVQGFYFDLIKNQLELGTG